MKTSHAAIMILVAACLLAAACGDDDAPTGSQQPSQFPAHSLTSPENLIAAIEDIYDDATHDAATRYAAYASLFPPYDGSSDLAFLFVFQDADVHAGLPLSWGLADELGVHHNMFEAQETGDIHSLTLDIEHTEAIPLESPQPGQEDWRSVFATNVVLRLMTTPDDGRLVDGGQAAFLCAPENDRWYIVQWTDRPRPLGAPASPLLVLPATWGNVKASFK